MRRSSLHPFALGALAVVLICNGLVAVATDKSASSVISASGRQMTSIFDGLVPSPQVRDGFVLKSKPLVPQVWPTLGNPNIGRILGVAPSASASSCPTGGTCASPGTTGEGGGVCQDPSGCDQDVDNPANSIDPCDGILELYECEQCCVNWFPCKIEGCSSGGTPAPPCGGSISSPGSTSSEIVCNCDPGLSPQDCSPIIIDTQGEGFHLTSAIAGVTFDISGTGHPVQIAWTDPRFHNAFLALPGPDGLVHNGKELFGNFTPQPPSANPNGFIALAQYDKPENGGNGDGIIDSRDQVFAKLRLWIDENHDGICQPNELHGLTEMGVYSLALNYTESRRTDGWGNQFRYKARVNPGEHKDPRDQTATGEPGRWTYDVFLVVN